MPAATNTRTYKRTAAHIDALYQDVRSLHNAVSHDMPDSPPTKRKYRNAVIRRANNLNRLQEAFMPKVYAAAAEVTQLCKPGWEKKPEILTLWHQLALTVTQFSEHPHYKQVATLILSPQGVLVAAATNRVPKGIPKFADYYEKGVRKDYVICSEPLAIAEALNVEINLSELISVTGKKLKGATKRAVAKFKEDILEVASSSDLLKGHHFLVTVSPCAGVCEPIITAARPQSLITVEHSGHHFTSGPGMLNARERMKQHMEIIFLPEPH
jgi:deoxycytidylate deaminase